MKAVSTLLGFLGRSGGKANTPEEGDTKISVPGLFLPVCEIPFPYLSLISAPRPGGVIEINSFIYAQEQTFAANLSEVICVLGPGVWDIECHLRLRQAGAVSDPTSNIRLDFFDQSTAQTVTLLRITNAQGIQQDQSCKLRVMATADTTFSFTKASVVGAGTGTNIYHFNLIGTRLF
jgi:hypothetical protein